MSSGFNRAFIVLWIVFGVESLLWGIFFLFRRNGRVRAIQSFLRGAFYIVYFSVAYYLFKRGFFQDQDISTVALLLGFSGTSLILEFVLAGGANRPPPKPMTAAIWQQQKGNKFKFMLVTTLGVGIVALTTAIVFRIVSPEVLGLRWWVLITIATFLAGSLIGIFYWNSNERKYGKQSSPATR